MDYGSVAVALAVLMAFLGRAVVGTHFVKPDRAIARRCPCAWRCLTLATDVKDESGSMTDLESRNWIVAKGVMFLAIALATAALILMEMASIRLAVLLAFLVWASCRFYYFLFYVLEHYVDPTMRYAGLFDLLMGMRQRRAQRRRDG